jgi:hypothetical protein
MGVLPPKAAAEPLGSVNGNREGTSRGLCKILSIGASAVTPRAGKSSLTDSLAR